MPVHQDSGMELSGSRCGEGGPPGGRESQREGALENFLPVHGCGCGQFGPDRLSQESKPATSLESLELRTDLAPPAFAFPGARGPLTQFCALGTIVGSSARGQSGVDVTVSPGTAGPDRQAAGASGVVGLLSCFPGTLCRTLTVRV